MDADPPCWTKAGGAGAPIDLDSESQESYRAGNEVGRRQKRVMSGEAGRSVKFQKYDLQNVIIQQNLSTPAEVIQWAKTAGGAAERRYVANNQREIRKVTYILVYSK